MRCAEINHRMLKLWLGSLLEPTPFPITDSGVKRKVSATTPLTVEVLYIAPHLSKLASDSKMLSGCSSA
jgi:hypothetical protein